MNFHSSLILFSRLCFCYIEAYWRYHAWNLLMHRVRLFSYHTAHLLKCPKWIYVKWRKFCNFNANTFSSKTQQNLNNQKVLQMYFLLLDDSKLNLLHKSGISRNYSILLYDIYPPNLHQFHLHLSQLKYNILTRSAIFATWMASWMTSFLLEWGRLSNCPEKRKKKNFTWRKQHTNNILYYIFFYEIT